MDNSMNIIDNYIKWVKDNTTFRSLPSGNSSVITTPFLDRHNDHIDIYVIKDNDEYLLTDDGYILSDLSMSGVSLATEKRSQLLQATLNGFGIKINDNNEIFVKTTLKHIGKMKHNLIQAILAVNDMYVLSQETVYSLFKEDVEMFFNAKGVIYSKDLKITGKTGFDHNIDFIISSSASKPERLIKAVNNPKKENIGAAIFSFNDISAIRTQKTNNIVIYNDIDQNASVDIVSALNTYGISGLAWSQKETFVENLYIR